MEKDTLLSSNRLFHYTSSLNNLISILRSGFQVRYSLERLELFELEKDGLFDELAFPMICFCDIPLELTENHRKVYGDYSIGLKKEWGLKNSICPVLYLTNKGMLQFIIKDMIKKVHKNNSTVRELLERYKTSKEFYSLTDTINIFNEILELSTCVKPFIGFYERKDRKFRDKNYKFYDEKEWRYRPDWKLANSFMNKEDFLKLGDDRNKNLGVISFCSDDITEILLPKNEIGKLETALKEINRFDDFDFSKIIAIDN